jgi:hypothetical protein
VTTIAPSTDYSDKDFASLRVRARNLISAAFPQWTDDNVADFGNTLVDLFCFCGDVLTKYQDNAALNSRWSTATQLSAVLSLVKMIGYVPSGQTASSVIETFTLAGPSPGDVVLPAGTLVQTQDVGAPVAYQLLSPLTIPAGTTTATGLVENSTSETDVFDSSGLLNQSVTLSNSPLLDGTEVVTAGNGLFARVANFLSSGPSDLVYTIATDANGVATITWGNGINGALPTGSISVGYKFGGGTAGQVDQATLNVLPGSFTDALGNLVSIAVTNALASSPAVDRQTLASIKQLAPLSIRPAGRAIARTDYEDVALQVPGVARALMLFATEDAAVAVNQGVLRIVTPGAIFASPSLLAAVGSAFVATPYAQTLDLIIGSADYLTVTVSCIAYKSSGTTGAAMKAGIVAALQYFFSPLVPATDLAGNPNDGTNGRLVAGTPNPAIDFGLHLLDENGNPAGVLNWSDLFDAIRNAKGVRKVDPGANGLLLNGVRNDVAIAVRQFPALGTVTVVDGDTNTVL